MHVHPSQPTAHSAPPNTRPRRAIGGDFEYVAPARASHSTLARLTGGLPGSWTVSGRAAFGRILAALRARGVQHVHLPAYLCESLLQPVRALGLEFSFYPVDQNLRATPEPPVGSAVLVVHYFGRLNPAAATLRPRSGRDFHLIEDAAQALLSDWQATVAADVHYVLSPRKFGPTPLGGWCSVPAKIAPRPDAIFLRCLQARRRKAEYFDTPGPVSEAEEHEYLTLFQDVERELEQDGAADGVPAWVVDAIAGIDWVEAARIRRANQARLAAHLGRDLHGPIGAFDEKEVPLGQVVTLNNRDAVRARLAAARIFCPVHWPLPAEVSRQRFPAAHALSERVLTLPVDQRYSAEDMDRVAATFREALQ